MNRQATQCVDILAYMRKHGSINPLQALESIGCMRLAARICDLRKAGYLIESIPVVRKTSEGKTVHYNEYRLAV